MPSSMLIQPSEDASYPAKRKSVSAAFWKAKLINMTTIVKSTQIDVMKDWVKTYPEIKSGEPLHLDRLLSQL